MTWEICNRSDKKSSCTTIYLPVFHAENEKEEQNSAKRMNDFYDYMAKCIEEFVISADFPGAGKYRACSLCEEKDGEINVTVSLELYQRGRRVDTKSLCHIWRDGVVSMPEGETKKKQKLRKKTV